MCLGIPGQILDFHPVDRDLAVVDVSGVKRHVNIGILERETLKPGDWVLIHVGFAMARMDEHEARSALAFLEQLGQAYEDEIAAFRESQVE
jgi:hydrogenase expression/formation protein HypC